MASEITDVWSNLIDGLKFKIAQQEAAIKTAQDKREALSDALWAAEKQRDIAERGSK